VPVTQGPQGKLHYIIMIVIIIIIFIMEQTTHQRILTLDIAESARSWWMAVQLRGVYQLHTKFNCAKAAWHEICRGGK